VPGRLDVRGGGDDVCVPRCSRDVLQAVLAEGLVLGGVEGASAALFFPLFRRLDVVGHGLWVSEDDVAADWRRPSLPARPCGLLRRRRL